MRTVGVWESEIEHGEEERVLCSRLYGVIVWFCLDLMDMVFVGAGLVRSVNGGGVCLGL